MLCNCFFFAFTVLVEEALDFVIRLRFLGLFVLVEMRILGLVVDLLEDLLAGMVEVFITLQVSSFFFNKIIK